MSLNIYIGKENLPEDKKVIHDVEAFFPAVPLKVDDFSKKVIRDIDKGELISADRFTDRFGVSMYLTDCSTGSKVVLSVKYSDYIILGDEMGFNCEANLLDITEGSIYFTSKNTHFTSLPKQIDVIVNGIHCSNINELWYRMEDIIC